MDMLKIVTEPAILIITGCFLWFIITVFSNYTKVNINLKRVCKFLHELDKKEISYRFNQINDFMSSNNYTSILWEDFKKALIFPEKLYLAAQGTKNPNETQSDIYLTIDSSYFFNEETLVTSKINHKFIQTMPTLLTGLGPFFTFLKMAIAFTAVNFTDDINIASSLSELIANIRIAALCSVFAVGFSLLFMFIEKMMYNNMCKKYYLNIQKEFIRLFDVVTSEKFLIDLVKESKFQSASNEKLIKALPDNFTKAITTCFGETMVPYLENILYSLNKINESLDNGHGGDVVDKLF